MRKELANEKYVIFVLLEVHDLQKETIKKNINTINNICFKKVQQYRWNVSHGK